MLSLYILLGGLVGLIGYLHYRLNKMHKAMETQAQINTVTKQAFDLLAKDIDKDRVLHDKTIKSVKAAITKLKKK